jgi:hypothetical protein
VFQPDLVVAEFDINTTAFCLGIPSRLPKGQREPQTQWRPRPTTTHLRLGLRGMSWSLIVSIKTHAPLLRILLFWCLVSS